LFLSFYFSLQGMEPRALGMLGKCSTTELHPQPLSFQDRILIHSLGWLQTHDPPTSAS
jgi:hypothetical protein